MDNLACTHLLVLPGGAWRTRHLRLRANHFREAIEQGTLCINHFAGHEMLPDLLTKPMAWSRMQSLLLLAGYILSNAAGDAARDMSHAMRSFLCLYLASQVLTQAEAMETEAPEMELDSLNEEFSVFSLSASELMFVGAVALFWEILKMGARWIWRSCLRLLRPTRRNQDRVGGRMVYEKIDTLLKGHRRDSSLGSQRALIELSYGLPTLQVTTISREDCWEIY